MNYRGVPHDQFLKLLFNANVGLVSSSIIVTDTVIEDTLSWKVALLIPPITTLNVSLPS